ncbi:M23 family peptidase [Rhodococcus rhodnii]|uniref:Lipoprotein n=2 Tax=Rhodococcus rhodnii TaxID=38312 RepID=R7WK96_9NOCA|nr:M23 family metallopeptidase [Rhodococcus rhodnii]EOM75741.1 lipoprotein [Rhodococcus rhodnii LMG 5362]TXG90175.1 M23 family peptidase [Rhodococcus rhodnii]
MHDRPQFTTSRFATGSKFDSQQYDSQQYDTGQYDTSQYDAQQDESTTTWTGAYEPGTHSGSEPARPYETYSDGEPDDEIPGFTPRESLTARAVRGAHRLPPPPGALKGRAAVIAVAAGAVVAAGQAAFTGGPDAETRTVALSNDENENTGTQPQAAQFSQATDPASATASTAPQVLNIAAPNTLAQFDNLLAKGQRFSEERAAREAAARKPLFVLPAIGTFTSSFGQRWGTLHAGVDIAAPIGTPIVAVADGTVIETGPASGFGMWVRLLHDDGTVTVYGHINESMVSQGQRVMAGDQIATVGNRGFSTGPHLHFEVHIGGVDKIDPIPWLASRGISLGGVQD